MSFYSDHGSFVHPGSDIPYVYTGELITNEGKVYTIP
jgi:hypothetical protein